MKNKIILLALCICFAAPMYAQSLDSLIDKQVITISNANADLIKSLPSSFIKSRELRQFQWITRKKQESMEYIKLIATTDDYHLKLEYVDKALKLYNKAVERLNALMLEARTKN